MYVHAKALQTWSSVRKKQGGQNVMHELKSISEGDGSQKDKENARTKTHWHWMVKAT